MRVVVRSVREELVIGREVRLGQALRDGNDCWSNLISDAFFNAGMPAHLPHGVGMLVAS